MRTPERTVRISIIKSRAHLTQPIRPKRPLPLCPSLAIAIAKDLAHDVLLHGYPGAVDFHAMAGMRDVVALVLGDVVHGVFEAPLVPLGVAGTVAVGDDEVGIPGGAGGCEGEEGEEGDEDVWEIHFDRWQLAFDAQGDGILS